MSLIWLGFLAFPVLDILSSDRSGGTKAGQFAIVAAFAIVYIWGMVDSLSTSTAFTDTLRPISVVFVGLAAIIITVALVVGIPFAVTFMIFLVALVIITLPPRIGYILGISIIVIFVPYSFHLYGFGAVGLAIIAISTYVSVVGTSYYTRQANREITLGKREAVVDERERVARDVHDVLGHTLTVISLKSDLAAKLMDRDPERAKAEIAEINDLSRQAIFEVRATVSGLSTRQLATELAAVQELAHDMGLAFHLEGSPEDVDPRHRILFGWVVRETMTNVIRHAEANSVHVNLGSSHIRMTDDGVGFDSESVSGNGLAGLRQRVEDVGGTMTVTSSGNSSTRWRAPAAGNSRTGTTIEVTV